MVAVLPHRSDAAAERHVHALRRRHSAPALIRAGRSRGGAFLLAGLSLASRSTVPARAHRRRRIRDRCRRGHRAQRRLDRRGGDRSRDRGHRSRAASAASLRGSAGARHDQRRAELPLEHRPALRPHRLRPARFADAGVGHGEPPAGVVPLHRGGVRASALASDEGRRIRPLQLLPRAVAAGEDRDDAARPVRRRTSGPPLHQPDVGSGCARDRPGDRQRAGVRWARRRDRRDRSRRRRRAGTR